MTTVFTSVLVANRGEIAVRIISTLHRLGIGSVAVMSEADRDSVHARLADESVLIGPADARSSYLSIERIVAAAVATGAQAIHPGYGFLSENADLADACEAAGVVFIGPDAATIRAMGDKRRAKDTVAALGIPTVPGFHRSEASDDDLVDAAEQVGLPLIVKPAAGGGGKGMKVVTSTVDLPAALASARREATSAFGDDTLMLERYIPAARHVEVQVVGDGRGGVVHLGDRDCSVQRRHQKVVEEAPAPFLPAETRAGVRKAAVAIAESVSYAGVGTVEFVVDADDPNAWYFLEMNTRLQVEHPVTEMVTGLDLVELQLRVAAGEGLPLSQDEVRIIGHAVEARVYAEDGHRDFLPSSGEVLAYTIPADVRVDSGIERGSVVSTDYDPLLLKVIAGGVDRAHAMTALDAALAHTAVLGVSHNIGVLRQILDDPEMRESAPTTSLIARRHFGSSAPAADRHRIIAAALALAHAREGSASTSPWESVVGWRVGDHAPVVYRLTDCDGDESLVSVRGATSDCTVSVDGGVPVVCALTASSSSNHANLAVSVGGDMRSYFVAHEHAVIDRMVWVGADGDSWWFRASRLGSGEARRTNDSNDGEVRSPMPGSVVALSSAVGDRVHEGQVLVVVEAMKMEYPLVAPFDGIVTDLGVHVGSQVARDQRVVTVVSEYR